jgi:hypothetical protein
LSPWRKVIHLSHQGPKADDSALLLSVIGPNLKGEYYLMQSSAMLVQKTAQVCRSGNGNVFHTNIALNF